MQRHSVSPSSVEAGVARESIDPPVSSVAVSWVPSPRRRGRSFPALLDWVAGLITSSGIAASFLLGADRVFRPDWDFTWEDHWVGSALLVGAVAGWLGLIWSLLVLVELAVTRPLRRRPGVRRWARAAFHAVLFGGLVWSTARWTFEGKRVSQTLLADVGPPLFVAVVMTVVAGFVWWIIGVERRCARGEHGRALLVGGGLIASSALPVWLDMTMYVSLYEPLHRLLEALAFALIFTGSQLVGFVVVRRWRGLLWASRGIAVSLVAYGATFALWPALRDQTDRLLGHTWVDEIYVGRALRRAQNIEATLQGTDPKSLEIVRVQRLVERYQLGDTSLHPSWDEPPPPSSAAVQELRGGPRNVLVFYVDTLRNDVARDPELMPAMVRFAEQSLDFRRAYAPGSDTLRTLPTMTGGNYYVQHNHTNDLCNIAQRGAHESVLVTPRSAHEFLRKLRPAFAFEKVIEVRDYAEEKKVWGYGADQPTAPKLVDETLAYIEQRPQDQPFFLWMFHFDQHSWREMEEGYVEERAESLGVPREGELNWRYRTIARSIDAEFERLIEGMERLGVLDDTVILVVADHGEGLGRAGFWVHSVFLWESLIRVPLILRVPGVEPRVVEDIVSLVDVAPTLAPFLGNGEERRGYQGVDLMAYAAGEHPERRHPLVLRAASRDRLVRIGLLDPETGLKLVVRLEAALPELYDLDADDPDATSVASQRPGMTRALLQRVATSPVFPREQRDFELLADLGVKEF